MKGAPALAALAALVLVARRTYAADEPTTRDELEALAYQSAAAHGASPRLLLATVDTESDWNASAVNQGEGDRQRGGAWGLTQLTRTTAVAVDDANGRTWSTEFPGRPGPSLLAPTLNLRLASFLLLEETRRSRAAGARSGSLEEARNVASLWNSGKLYAAAPTATRDVHVPRFVSHWLARSPEVSS